MQYMKFIVWNKRKIWKPEQYEITPTLLPHNSYSYVVYSVHEYFAETDSHLQISQHQASLKHENFTVSYHSHSTLLPQNILQLQLHLSCTLDNINNLRLTKIRVSWNGGLTLHVPHFQMFLTLRKFDWGCSSWSKFHWGCCNFSERL